MKTSFSNEQAIIRLMTFASSSCMKQSSIYCQCSYHISILNERVRREILNLDFACDEIFPFYYTINLKLEQLSALHVLPPRINHAPENSVK